MQLPQHRTQYRRQGKQAPLFRLSGQGWMTCSKARYCSIRWLGRKVLATVARNEKPLCLQASSKLPTLLFCAPANSAQCGDSRLVEKTCLLRHLGRPCSLLSCCSFFSILLLECEPHLRTAGAPDLHWLSVPKPCPATAQACLGQSLCRSCSTVQQSATQLQAQDPSHSHLLQQSAVSAPIWARLLTQQLLDSPGLA